MSTVSVDQTSFARKLRQKENDAEAALWSELRGRRLNGYKFVREMPVASYFADFACKRRNLIVELDGSQHLDCLKDDVRDAHLNGLGWSVLRFQNVMIFEDRSVLLDTIVEVLEGRVREKIENGVWDVYTGTCTS